MHKFKPKDLIALVVIVGYFLAKLQGLNGFLDPALFLILGYYFVKRTNGADNGT